MPETAKLIAKVSEYQRCLREGLTLLTFEAWAIHYEARQAEAESEGMGVKDASTPTDQALKS